MWENNSRRTLALFLWMVGVGFAYAEEPSVSDLNLDFLKKQEKAAVWGRDPFALPQESGEARAIGPEGGDLLLSAIIYRAGRGVAIINDRIVRVGETVEGKRVIRILPDRVELMDTGGFQELTVRPLTVRGLPQRESGSAAGRGDGGSNRPPTKEEDDED